MIDVELRSALHALGIDESSRDVLALLPLVWVAWADGMIQPAEHAVISTAAGDSLKLSADATRVLDNWLAHPPTEAYLDRGCAVLLELDRRAGGPGDLSLPDLCRAVAQAAGSFFGRVNAPERDALATVALALSVDPGTGWKRVAAALHERPSEMEWLDDEHTNAGVAAPSAAPAAHGLAGLVMGSQGGDERVCTLDQGVVRVGRGHENTLHLAHDAQASRFHCELFQREGRTFVKDLGSLNGTIVGGERIVERELFGGEHILVGETTLVWRGGIPGTA